MKSTLWFFFLDKWNFGNRTFDSILFVLSIREIFDSATSRDHAMKFWKLIWSKGSRLKISFHAQLLDLDCFSNRNLTKFSKVRLRRVNLQARSINLHQIGSHHQTRVTRSIPRRKRVFLAKIEGNDLEKEFCTVISRTTHRKAVYLGPYVFRAYHWYRLKPLATCIDESDPLLPSLSHSYRIFLSSTMMELHAPSFETIL